MTHDHLRMLLPRYAAGTLGSEHVTAVQSHLATGCSSCLDDLFRLPVGMPREVPPPPSAPLGTPPSWVAPPPAPRPPSLPHPEGRVPTGRTLTPSGAVAATAGLALIACSLAIWHDNVRRDRDQLGMALELFETERTAVREILTDLHTGGGVQSLSLSAPLTPGSAQGVALWNPGHPGIVLLVNGLPSPAPSAGYRVSVTSGTGGRTTARFSVSQRGDAVVPLRLVGQPNRVQRIEIGDDTTGTTFLVGMPRAEVGAAELRPAVPVAAAGPPPRR